MTVVNRFRRAWAAFLGSDKPENAGSLCVTLTADTAPLEAGIARAKVLCQELADASRSAEPSLAIVVPRPLSQSAVDRLRSEFRAVHTGPRIFDGSLKVYQLVNGAYRPLGETGDASPVG